MFNLDDIKPFLNTKLIRKIDMVPRGHIRIETGFLYPDGASIDIFLQQRPDELDISEPVLTDFGSTFSWLQNIDVKPNKSKSQKAFFDRILDVYGCRLNGAALEHGISDIKDLHNGIIKIGQACLRISDFIYTKRLRAQSSFNQECEDALVEITQDYTVDADIPLRDNAVVRVDFMVRGRKADSAIQTLASGNPQYAHTRAVEINARWDDLREMSDWLQKGGQIVTIFDDKQNYDSKDMARLERKGFLLPLSDSETLTKVLLAA